MQQIGLAIAMYHQDYDEQLISEYYGFPTSPACDWTGVTHFYSWRGAIQPYIKSINVFCCPSNSLAQSSANWYFTIQDPSYPTGYGNFMPSSYATNQDLIGFANGPCAGLSAGVGSLAQIDEPAATIMIADTQAPWNDTKLDWIGATSIGSTAPIDLGGGPGVPTVPGQFQGNAIPNFGPLTEFQNHQGFVNFVFADSHVKAMKLAQTILPTSLWDENPPYNLTTRQQIVSYMPSVYN
jgi:prepilin-type processing-associated H-X9-DG protein